MRIGRLQIPVIATLFVLVALYVTAGLLFDGFFSARVLVNFVGDHAFLGIVAVGMTFVILTGGIDLSVGAVVGCATISAAVLIDRGGWHPAAAFLLVLFGGTALGTLHGLLIQKYSLQPFLVTLAGLFLCRGAALWISTESVAANHPFVHWLYGQRIPLAEKLWLPFTAIVFLIALAIAVYVAKFTRFGRTVYAIGGGEQSAVLMGLPVARTKIAVYALSGFCSALGGLVFVVYTSAGNSMNGMGLELDAIATVVIGGTLLTGGYGSVFGTFLGLMIFAVIQQGLLFMGTNGTWWSRISTGLLLLAFILLQRALQRNR